MSYTDTARASRVMNLQPQALFINPEVEMETCCCLFLTANKLLITFWYLRVTESSYINDWLQQNKHAST
jgi:hypothetical protein